MLIIMAAGMRQKVFESLPGNLRRNFHQPMGKTNTDKCNLCLTSRESIQHLFWQCNITQIFWTHLTRLINEKCPNATNMRLSEDLILFGYDRNIAIDKTVAFILTFAKKYVFQCKYQKRHPNLNEFTVKLCARFKVEEYNARIEGSFNEFHAEWAMYKDLF